MKITLYKMNADLKTDEGSIEIDDNDKRRRWAKGKGYLFTKDELLALRKSEEEAVKKATAEGLALRKKEAEAAKPASKPASEG